MLMTTPDAAGLLTPLQAFVLGAIQGLTELFPVSSSAHLYVVPHLLGWPYAGLAFDVALHGGTLLALVIAFRNDWIGLFRDFFARDAAVRRDTRSVWLQLVLASIPAAIVGKLLGDIAEDKLRSMPLQAIMLFVFGGLLWAADRFLPKGREVSNPGLPAALAMGFAQCLALVPGVSRSGITMTAGRASGLSRISAARFSFLLATPITFGALLLKGKDLPADLDLKVLAIGVVSAAVFGILAIRVLMAMLKRVGFGFFFAYRAVLALVILVWLRGH
ncbi:MAG: undecaprenyl-diphosphate phosphatase [Candidatus Eisenbacteria bacterium]